MPPRAADYAAVTYTGLRERLRRREPLAVAFLDLGSPVSAELTAMAGFDVVVVDLEHGAGDEGAARLQIQAAGAHAAVVVRVPDGPAQAGRMLDAGADGVIVPQVGSPEEAERAARTLRYGGGGRGISPFSRGNRYGAAGADFRPRADERVACVIQIERASALETVEEIAAIDDVDALLMGPADLSNDLGCELDLEGAQLRDAAQRIAAAAERHGKTAALHLGRADLAPGFRALGFTMLSSTFESAVLRGGLANVATRLKSL
jgi:4-hydroxy-2-oxoheptanedioate aldolase